MTVCRGVELLNEIERRSKIANDRWENKDKVMCAKGMQKQAERQFRQLSKSIQKKARDQWVSKT